MICKLVFRHPILAALFATTAVLGLSQQAHAEEEIVGGTEYLNSCAACHGVGGRGDGPVAEVLNVPPSDLTTLAARHDGTFPFLKVFQIIDGRTMAPGHGEREMPVWGQRYREQAVAGDTLYERWTAEPIVRSRILELVNYLQAIQDPQPDATVLPPRRQAQP